MTPAHKCERKLIAKLTRTRYWVPYFVLTCNCPPNHALPHHVFRGQGTRAEKIKVLLFRLHLDGRLVTSFYNCEASVSLGIGLGFYIPHMGLPPEYLSHASAVWQG